MVAIRKSHQQTMLIGGHFNAQLAFNILTFGTFYMRQTLNTSEPVMQIPIPFPLTMSLFTLWARSNGTNTLDGNTTLRIRKNALDSAIVINVPAGLLGVFQDDTNVEPFAFGDLISFEWDTNASTVGVIDTTSVSIRGTS